MINEIWSGSDISILNGDSTKGLRQLKFHHPVGTFSLTPASKILLDAIINNQDRLSGIGIDWGTGIGCQAILASKIPTVSKVYGLEISEENLKWAKINAEENNVTEKVRFMLSDSYTPSLKNDWNELQSLKGKVDFIISNPPSSDWDDGFGFRRIVLEGAREYLVQNGIVLLNISFQYSMKRVEWLHRNISGYTYSGVAASTDWVPFDLKREDLLECIKVYDKVERNGGIDYTFSEDGTNDHLINARTALQNYNNGYGSPFTKWQTHLFTFNGRLR